MLKRDQSDIISSDEVKSVVLKAYSRVDSLSSKLAEAICPDDPRKTL